MKHGLEGAGVGPLEGNRYLDLVKRHHALQDEIDRVRRREVKRVVSCIVKMMEVYGLDLEQIKDGVERQSSPHREVEPKYMDPQTGKTWSGRGRMPLWMRDKRKEDYLLPAP
ncbi:H-NS histone family protein [Burkholderia ambifaria]|uniref:Histone family protein nucleoid-structuring protein H-NS n=1 Tax=Burkholderia ambifaria MEX-5 TaxID=396597 RepID=B1TFR0_9BURK|nr:H-NS histone family protein [Burkholderia ambifaria]EDT37600.1 histone family protein nucleoid-structuring protein H-NS [Burkholderia ambifaria MEX-5]